MSFNNLKPREVEQLFTAILKLQNLEECHQFFDDLCTIGEIRSLAQRLEVARMLQGRYTYNQIEAETGASTATISRVKRCLYYGTGGYKVSLERLKKEENS